MNFVNSHKLYEITMTEAPTNHQTSIGIESSSIKVWDPVVRLFHWTVVTGCAVDYFLLSDGETAHRWVGYTVGIALVVRVSWGFLASGHARFASFVRGPRTIIEYLRTLKKGEAPRHVGHNPAAAAMIVTLMLTLATIIVTGWMQTTDSFWGVGWVQDLHGLAADGLMALVVVHASAAVFESMRHRENLIWSMVTGHKRAE
jgi:cytochrome b